MGTAAHRRGPSTNLNCIACSPVGIVVADARNVNPKRCNRQISGNYPAAAGRVCD